MSFVLDLYCPRRAYQTYARSKLIQRATALVQKAQKLRSKEERALQEQELERIRARLKNTYSAFDRAINELCKAYQALWEEHEKLGAQVLFEKLDTEEAKRRIQSLREQMDSIRFNYEFQRYSQQNLECQIETIDNYFFDKEEAERLEKEAKEWSIPLVPRIPE